MKTISYHAFRRVRLAVAALLFTVSASLTACAPVTTTVSNLDAKVRTFERKSAPGEPITYIASCETPTDFVHACKVEVENTCSATTVEVIDRTIHTKRTTTAMAKALEYCTALALMAAGAGVTADAHNVHTSGDPGGTNPVGRAGAYGIGISLATVGAGVLALGITDSARAIDLKDRVGEIELPGAPRTFKCNRRPLVNKTLWGQVGNRRIEMGTTLADGHFQGDVRKVPTELVLGSSPSSTLVIYADTTKLVEIPLGAYQKAIYQKRLREAIEAEPFDEKLRFFNDCIDAEHILDDRTELKALTISTLVDIEAQCKNANEIGSLEACEKLVASVEKAITCDEASTLHRSLTMRRDAIEERIRLQEERRLQAEQARLDAWTKSHIPAARRFAINEMLDNLKVPSSARIRSTKVIRAEGTEYMVHMVVDAQNAFGVFLRTGYCVSIELLKDDPKRYIPQGVVDCGVSISE